MSAEESKLKNPTAGMFSTNRKLEITNLFALLAGGILIKIIFYSEGPGNAIIWGYLVSALATFFLIIIGITFTSGTVEKNSLLEKTLSLTLQPSIPTILFLLLLIWSISMGITFFNDLQNRTLPKDFHNYSLISSFLLSVQAINLYMFYNEKATLIYMDTNPEDQIKDQEKLEKSGGLIYV